jgi:hypothetical protein
MHHSAKKSIKTVPSLEKVSNSPFVSSGTISAIIYFRKNNL